MTGKRLVLMASAPLVLCAGIAGGVYAASTRPTIYSVSEVASGLNQNPSAWVGRTVLIWGRDLTVRWGCGIWWTPVPRTARGASVSTCRPGTFGTFERLMPADPTQAFWAGNGPRPWTSVRYSIRRAGVRLFVFGRGLVVQRRPGAQVPATNAPVGLFVQLARLPILGRFVPAMLVESGAVYRVRLLDSSHCSSPPCPEGEVL